MRVPTASRLTDILTHVASVCLAVVCLVFAGYKVIKLRQMENPPADMGLNFPPPKRKIITDESIEVDSLTTGTISGPQTATRTQGRIVQPYAREAPVQDYRLVTVIQGVAFVELQSLRGKKVVPLVPGAWLSGAGQVERVSLIDGRWTLIAGSVRLVAEGQ